MEERVAGGVVGRQHLAHHLETRAMCQKAIAVQDDPLPRIFVSVSPDPGEFSGPRAGLDSGDNVDLGRREDIGDGIVRGLSHGRYGVPPSQGGKKVMGAFPSALPTQSNLSSRHIQPKS